MMKWGEKLPGHYVASLMRGVLCFDVARFGGDGKWAGAVFLGGILISERINFTSVEDAKKWCEAEARRMLTEELEKLND